MHGFVPALRMATFNIITAIIHLFIHSFVFYVHPLFLDLFTAWEVSKQNSGQINLPCWRQNVLVTISRCWWQLMSLRYGCWYQNLKWVTNINPWSKDATKSPTFCLQPQLVTNIYKAFIFFLFGLILNPWRLQNDIRGTVGDCCVCLSGGDSYDACCCFCCTLNQIHRQIGLDLKRRREESK